MKKGKRTNKTILQRQKKKLEKPVYLILRLIELITVLLLLINN